MKKTILTIFAICLTLLTFGQSTENKKIIELAKAYKDFMFRNTPTKEELAAIKSDCPDNLKSAAEFIAQAVTTDNKILTAAFLNRPDDKILKQIYIIEAVNQNLRVETQLDNNKLIDSLTKKDISVYDMVDNYYYMVFNSVGNKNQPFNMSKADFKMNDYKLKDDTEKGILFLQCMRLCGTEIWGYMNIPKPANTKKAFASIKKFPKFNGRPYYQYSDFYFTDFEIVITEGKGLQSYKTYYIDKYYHTLMYHVICLNEEGADEDDRNDLLLGSILKDRNLYKYTPLKPALEKTFKEVKKD